MNIYEIFEPTPKGYSDQEEDGTSIKISDVRKTRLTLGQLNKLRIMNDVRKLEHEQKLLKVKQQYKVPAAENGMSL